MKHKYADVWSAALNGECVQFKKGGEDWKDFIITDDCSGVYFTTFDVMWRIKPKEVVTECWGSVNKFGHIYVSGSQLHAAAVNNRALEQVINLRVTSVEGKVTKVEVV